MHARATIDQSGRVVIPAALRKELNLQTGDALDMECTSDRITLRPLRSNGTLVNENGVWVIGTGEPMTAQDTDEILRRIREERDLSNLCP